MASSSTMLPPALFNDKLVDDNDINKWIKFDDNITSSAPSTFDIYESSAAPSFSAPLYYSDNSNNFAPPFVFPLSNNSTGNSTNYPFAPSFYGGASSNTSAPKPAPMMKNSGNNAQNFQQIAPIYQLFNQFQQFFKQQQSQSYLANGNNKTINNASLLSMMEDPLFSGALLGSCGEGSEPTNDKKRGRPMRGFTRRVRQTRPKVVEAKGAVQCQGRNRKKGTQCRNAALMEYIGPRPSYCAEHIELDPSSLYEKCKSSYQREVGDNKGCKEVVLKEFGVCYKHYHDRVNDLIQTNNLIQAQHDLNRTTDLLAQLEKEANAAKKKDGDLYQRKNKLIPKFQEMKKLSQRALDALESFSKNPHQPMPLVSPISLPAFQSGGALSPTFSPSFSPVSSSSSCEDGSPLQNYSGSSSISANNLSGGAYYYCTPKSSSSSDSQSFDPNSPADMSSMLADLEEQMSGSEINYLSSCSNSSPHSDSDFSAEEFEGSAYSFF